MALELRRFERKDVEPSAELLASRHERDRKRDALLPGDFESPDTTRPLIEALSNRDDTTGVVAVRGGELAGYLLATAMLPAPTHFLSQLFPPRSMAVPYQGHAVAASEDKSLYRELYGDAAAGWVARGFFHHFVNVAHADAEARDVWDSLGFGRDATCAVRDVNDTVDGVDTVANISINQAGPEDISVIEALNAALTEHHAASPIFAPNLADTQRGSREMSVGLLSDPSNAHFLAYRDGRPLGMQTFMPTRFVSPMLLQEASIYLFQGIVYPEARSGGVGRALLKRSMEWAQEQGHRWCALHFAAPNPSGAKFWLGNGFRPVEHRLHRYVDERIAWAGS